MRTIKALACAAALAAGLATAAAQNVYSLNVVGYYNITCAADALTIVANQLNTTNNTIGSLIPAPPSGSQFFKFTGTWGGIAFDGEENTWGAGGTTTLAPGEGGFFKSYGAAYTLTFVGEVLQGALSNPLPAADVLGVRSSMVPQAGRITTDLGFPAEGGDQVFKYTGTWGSAAFDGEEGTWGTEPTFGVGESFYVKKYTGTTATAWTRTFTVQ